MNLNLIFDFISNYWREILSVICLIISVVFYIIKRRPMFNLVDLIKEDVLELLPRLINTVEIDGNGQRKKDAVIDIVINYVKKIYHLDFSPYEQWLSDNIENILTTPTKKGVYHER